MLISLDLVGTEHLKLADFDPTLLTPSWVPIDRWQSILSLSTLPGPLEQICTTIVNDPKWQEWYHDDEPEKLKLPGLGEVLENTTSEALNTATDFHSLLVLRCLRPDRLVSATKKYVEGILNNLHAQINATFPDILKQIEHSIPILILLPNNSLCDISTCSPTEMLLKFAEVTT